VSLYRHHVATCSTDEGRLGRIEGSSTGCTSKKDNLLASGRLKNDLFEGEK